MNSSTNKTRAALKITSGIKAGALASTNHNRALKVTSGIKAGGFNAANHNLPLIPLL